VIGSWLVWLRLVKLLAVALLASGTVGAFLPRDLEDRQRAAYALAGPGFGLSWVCGFLMIWAQQRSLLSGWLLGAAVLSVFSLNVVLWSTGKDGRRGPIAAALAIGSLALTIALMVLRPE
jgi:peptidoglycan/LPS O-acetylase OafA/YrhL